MTDCTMVDKQSLLSGWDDIADDTSHDYEEDEPLIGRHNRRLRGSGVYVNGTILTSRQIHGLLYNLNCSANVLEGVMRQRSVVPSVLDEQEEEESTARCCRWDKLPYWLARHLCLITFLMQMTKVGTISLLDAVIKDEDKEEHYVLITGSIMISLEILNLAIAVLTTVYLTKQIAARCVNPSFLAQSYVSTVLVFAGLYTVTYRMQPSGWHDINTDSGDANLVAVLYLKMLFLSISTATLCGSSNIIPSLWYNYMFLSTQMLLSFLYFAQILAQYILPPTPSEGTGTSNRRPRDHPGLTTRQRRDSY